MGAGAAKQYQSDKTRHAEKVFDAVRAYEAAHPDEYNNEYAHLQGFKTRVQLAAVEAKRKGKEIDSALAQLSDADLETLRKFVEDNWRQKEEERKRKNENAANEAMTVEEFVEEDPNLNDNAQDETTSVLSYGDGEEGHGEIESDGEIDSSRSLLLGKSKSRDDGDMGESSGEIVEDLEVQNEHSVDHGRGAAVKIFPMDVVTDMAGLGYTTPNRKAPNKQQVTVRVDEAKDMGIANALAKFWEIDEVGSIQSQLNLGADSPRAGSFSPFSPDIRSSRRSLESMATRERNKNLDERNERLMGLQRQKVMSFTQNAKLEREVEALQRQLERMEELDRVAGIPNGTSSSSIFQATPVRLHSSMQSSASSIYNSATNTPIQGINTSNSLLSNQRSNQNNNHQPSKLSYIYPIDEETNDWNNSLMNTPDAKLVPNQLKPHQRGYYQIGRDKKNSITSSSSSDEEANVSKNSSYGMQQRIKQPLQPSISNNSHNNAAPSKSKLQSSISSNRQGRNNRSEDKINSSPSAASINNTPNAPTSSSQFHFNNLATADGKNTHNTTTPQNQDKYASLAGNMSDVSNNSHVKNSSNRGGRRTRYRTNSNAGDDSDDSTSNNSKAIFSTPNNNNSSNSSNKLFSGGDRDSRRTNFGNNNNGVNSNYASDSDTNTSNQIMPLSARGTGGKSISASNVANTNSGKKLNISSSNNNSIAGAKMVQSSNNITTTTATSSSTSLDPSVLNNVNSSPVSHSPSKRHAEARRARNTIQTETDHKLSPTHNNNSNNSINNGNIPQPSGLNRRGLSNKHNHNNIHNGNEYSEDEQSAVGTKGPSKNNALKRLNKRRHSADGLTDLNANNNHNSNNPQFTPADESQIKALLEKQISDLSQQSPMNLQALGKKISHSNNNKNDEFTDAKRVPSLDQQTNSDKSSNRNNNNKKHPGAILNPSDPMLDDDLLSKGQYANRPSNAPKARQQGSGMLSDQDFDALFAAVDMEPGAELSPGQRQQEVFRHNQTGSSVMSSALATGSQQLPDASLLNTSTTTNSEENNTNHIGHAFHGHHSHHGRHHHHQHHHHQHHHKQQYHQQQENNNRILNMEDISPSQTQKKIHHQPTVTSNTNSTAANSCNTGAEIDTITSMTSAATVVNNIQNLKKKGIKGSRHHSVSTRQSVGSNNNNTNTNNTNSATEDTAATAVDNDWSDELDHAWAEVSFILRKPIKTEEDMMYTVAAAEAGIIFTDQMNTYAKTLQVLRGALSRWLLPYDNNTRIETQCSTPHSVVENMPDEFRGKLTERQVHYLVAGANEVRKLVRIKIADDNDLEQARQALKTTDAFFKKLYLRAKQLDVSPFELLKKSGTF